MFKKTSGSVLSGLKPQDVLRVVLNGFKNTNEEYFIGYKANARDVLSVFDRLLGLWVINEFLKEL